MQVSRRFMVVGVLALLALSAAACGRVTPTLDDKAAVGAVIGKWSDAELKEDATALASLFASEIAVSYDGEYGETIAREDMVTQESSLWAEGAYSSFAFTNMVVSVIGDTATVTAHLQLQLQMTDYDYNWDYEADVAFTLNKQSGKWVITGLDFTNIESEGLIL